METYRLLELKKLRIKKFIYSFIYLFINNTYERLFITHNVCYITVTPFQLKPLKLKLKQVTALGLLYSSVP